MGMRFTISSFYWPGLDGPLEFVAAGCKLLFVCIQGPHVDGCSPETLFIISKLTETCLFPPILI